MYDIEKIVNEVVAKAKEAQPKLTAKKREQLDKKIATLKENAKKLSKVTNVLARFFTNANNIAKVFSGIRKRINITDIDVYNQYVKEFKELEKGKKGKFMQGKSLMKLLTDYERAKVKIETSLKNIETFLNKLK